MAVEVGEAELSLLVNTDEANEEVARWAEDVKDDLGGAGKAAGKAFGRRLGEQVGEHLLDVKGKLKEVFTKELPGIMGDLGDAAGMLGKNFGLLNKETAESISNAAGLMEKFGQLGGTLGGPYGAAAGVALGATVALRNELVEAQKAARQFQSALAGLGAKIPDLVKEQEELRKEQKKHDDAWAGITSKGGLAEREGLSKGAKKLAEDFGFIKKEVAGAGKAAKEAKGPFDDLFATFDKADKAQAAVRKLNAEVMEMLERDFGSAPPAAVMDMEAIEEYQFAALLGVSEVNKELTAQQDTALAVAEAWGTHALGGFEKFLDGVQAGNKILGNMKWDKALVAFLRLTGSQLMASGLQHELAAAAQFFLGNTADATGLALVGAAELATGAAMGGTGALVGRRRGVGSGGGGRDDAGGSGGGSLFGGSLSLGKGAMGGNTTSNTNNTYIIQALDVGDRELWERLGARVERGRRAFKRAGGKLFDGRD
jgi:hypothetical protein